MEDRILRRTWAEIDLDALAHNYRALRALTPEGCKFLGLVKANAYGHGAVPVAKKLETLGCDMLAVACLAEAAQLRQAGITLPILCLGYTPVEETEALLRYHVTQTVGDLDTGRALSEAAQRAGSDKVNTVELLHAMRSKTPDAIRAMLDDEPFLNRQKLVFSKLLNTADLPEETRLAAAKRMLEGEEDYHRVVRITDTVAKLGPMFGLLGTLIPLGPGVMALGQGDTVTLSQSMSIAFDTTIAGIITAAVCAPSVVNSTGLCDW